MDDISSYLCVCIVHVKCVLYTLHYGVCSSGMTERGGQQYIIWGLHVKYKDVSRSRKLHEREVASIQLTNQHTLLPQAKINYWLLARSAILLLTISKKYQELLKMSDERDSWTFGFQLCWVSFYTLKVF